MSYIHTFRVCIAGPRREVGIGHAAFEVGAENTLAGADVILIGEVANPPTWNFGLQFAEPGTLCPRRLLHANTPNQALDRDYPVFFARTARQNLAGTCSLNLRAIVGAALGAPQTARPESGY